MSQPTQGKDEEGKMAQRQRADTDFLRLSLRLREALRRQLAAAAKEHKTTLNGEILDRLEASFLHEETKIRHGQEALREARVEQILEEIKRAIEGFEIFKEVFRGLPEIQARQLGRGKPPPGPDR
jgi:hypothetical protein